MIGQYTVGITHEAFGKYDPCRFSVKPQVLLVTHSCIRNLEFLISFGSIAPTSLSLSPSRNTSSREFLGNLRLGPLDMQIAPQNLRVRSRSSPTASPRAEAERTAGPSSFAYVVGTSRSPAPTKVWISQGWPLSSCCYTVSGLCLVSRYKSIVFLDLVGL